MIWQPIASAPRDGTVILLAKGREVYAGWYHMSWDGYCWWFVEDQPEMLTKNTKVPKAGVNGFHSMQGPTHWMPLPTHPFSELDDED